MPDYTEDDLKKVSLRYEENFRMIRYHINDPAKRQIYIERERKLNDKCIEIQKYLQIYVDPDSICPLTARYKNCVYCTGFYKKDYTTKGNPLIDCSDLDAGAMECKWKTTLKDLWDDDRL